MFKDRTESLKKKIKQYICDLVLKIMSCLQKWAWQWLLQTGQEVGKYAESIKSRTNVLLDLVVPYNLLTVI